MNRGFLIGDLVQVTEMRYTNTGLAVLEPSLLVDDSYEDRKTKERVEKFTSVPITLFGKSAENFAKLVSKGACVYVEYALDNMIREGQDGRKWNNLKAKALSWKFVGHQKSAPKKPHSTPDNPSDPEDVEMSPRGENEDIPF